MVSFLLDLRGAVRRLLAKPSSTLVAILALSIGIGAVSTLYVLFRAGGGGLPPVPEPDRIAPLRA